MKALTISQPFASMIMRGEKFVENRTWATNYRGQLAIHAGKGTQYLSYSELENYPTGRIIAVCQLVACVSLEEIKEACDDPSRRHELVPNTRLTWTDIEQHEHTEGPYCWILEDVQKVQYVEVSGKQGLWSYNEQDSLQMEFEFQ